MRVFMEYDEFLSRYGNFIAFDVEPSLTVEELYQYKESSSGWGTESNPRTIPSIKLKNEIVEGLRTMDLVVCQIFIARDKRILKRLHGTIFVAAEQTDTIEDITQRIQKEGIRLDKQLLMFPRDLVTICHQFGMYFSLFAMILSLIFLSLYLVNSVEIPSERTLKTIGEDLQEFRRKKLQKIHDDEVAAKREEKRCFCGKDVSNWRSLIKN